MFFANLGHIVILSRVREDEGNVSKGCDHKNIQIEPCVVMGPSSVV